MLPFAPTSLDYGPGRPDAPLEWSFRVGLWKRGELAMSMKSGEWVAVLRGYWETVSEGVVHCSEWLKIYTRYEEELNAFVRKIGTDFDNFSAIKKELWNFEICLFSQLLFHKNLYFQFRVLKLSYILHNIFFLIFEKFKVAFNTILVYRRFYIIFVIMCFWPKLLRK